MKIHEVTDMLPTAGILIGGLWFVATIVSALALDVASDQLVPGYTYRQTAREIRIEDIKSSCRLCASGTNMQSLDCLACQVGCQSGLVK